MSERWTIAALLAGYFIGRSVAGLADPAAFLASMQRHRQRRDRAMTTGAEMERLAREIALWKLDHQREALRANRAEDRFLRAEAVLKSIAANSCCDKCQEAARVAQAYFSPPTLAVRRILTERPNDADE